MPLYRLISNPPTNDGAALGTTLLNWSDLFLASGAVINFNAGDVTITHSTNTLAFAGASSGYSFAEKVAMGGTTHVGGGATVIGTNSAYNGEAGDFAVCYNAATTKRLYMGWDNTNLNGGNGGGYIQAINNGVTTSPLFLQPVGNRTMIGGATTPTHTLQLIDDDGAKTTTTTWATTSDRRTKKNIRPYSKSLEDILKLQPVEFEYNGKAGTINNQTAVSLIAQDTVAAIPDTRLFKTHKIRLNDIDDEDEPEADVYSFNPHELFFMFINTIKELNTRIEELEKK